MRQPILFILILFTFPLGVYAQKKPVKGEIKLFATVDPATIIHETQVVVSHTDFEAEEDQELEKRKKERLSILGEAGLSDFDNDAQRATKTSADAFAQGISINGNDHDGIPPDNHLAVGDNGYIVSVANSTVKMFDSTGKQLRNMKLSAFANNDASLNFVFDPRVIYDPVARRYIMVFLNGGTPSTSTVVICFSTTSNPTQTWKIYKLAGNFLKDDSWFDYPSIGISKNEVFVSGNLFYGSNNSFNRAIILQISKQPGYSGATTLKYQYWTDLQDDYGVAVFSPVPASHGQDGEVGPEMYFVSTPSRGGDFVQITTISNELSDPNVTYTCEEVLIDKFDVPSNGRMKNAGNKFVRTNDCRTQDAFMMNKTLFFTFHGTNTSSIYSRIYFGKYHVKDRKIKMTSLGLNLYHYCFPALASFGNDTTDEAVVFGFLSTSTSTFPDCRYVLCDKNMGWTNSFLIYQGTTFFSNLSGTQTERWGDYTGTVREPRRPIPTVWVHACYPSTSGKYANRVAEIRGIGVKSEDPETPAIYTEVFPNPAEETFNVRFSGPGKGAYQLKLLDAQGRLVKTLSVFNSGEGNHTLSFTKGSLPAGIYFVEIEWNQKSLSIEKVVIP